MQTVLEQGSIDKPLTFDVGLIQLSFIPVCSLNTCNISVKLCRGFALQCFSLLWPLFKFSLPKCNMAIKSIKNALDTAFELSKLLKFSSKRNAQFKNIHAEIAPEQPGFRTLCPTRWTVLRASSLNSILENYTVIQKNLDTFADSASQDPEMSVRCAGVATQF